MDMAAAEEKSWEYTLGCIDERTENSAERVICIGRQGGLSDRPIGV